MFVVTHINQKN